MKIQKDTFEENTVKGLKYCDKTFEQIYISYFHYLCVYAQKIVGHKETAENIVQDFFMKFWQIRDTIQIETSLKAYFLSSVRNNCLKYLKHNNVRRKYNLYTLTNITNSDLKEEADYKNPLNIMISQEIMNEIEIAIDILPAQCKEIFELVLYEELNYHEIAKKIGVSIGAVGKQINIARFKIKNHLKKFNR